MNRKKTKEFRTVCLTNATISCKWGGNEDEYYRLQDLQRKFQQKCSERESFLFFKN